MGVSPDKLLNDIIESHYYGSLFWSEREVRVLGSPEPGKVYTTGLQMGNFPADAGSNLYTYIGVVLQVRRKCGVCGTDIVIMGNLDGSISTHENQHYCRLLPCHELLIRCLYPKFKEFDAWDYENIEISIAGRQPATGAVVSGEDLKSETSIAFSVTVSQDGKSR